MYKFGDKIELNQCLMSRMEKVSHLRKKICLTICIQSFRLQIHKKFKQ